MKNHLYLSLVAGIVGGFVGAGSMYVVDASIIRPHFVHSAAVDQRPGIREIQADGNENSASDTHGRVNVLRGKGY